ncbi:MAG: DUF4221 family protein [Bacteroidota bacterium]|nr:DUF4221 family protein [Bacteroidota bacterium]
MQKLVSFIVIVFLFGCANENQPNRVNNNVLSQTLIAADTLVIPAPFPSIPHTYCLQVLKINNVKYLARKSDNTNSIELINLKTKKIEEKWVYKLEGPDGIGDMNGFYILNRDTIFVGGLYRTWIKRSNSKGKIFKTISLDKNSVGKRSSIYRVESRISTRKPILKCGRDLFIPVDEWNSNKYEVTDEPVIFYAKYHIGANYCSLVKLPFPKVYQGKIWGNFLMINSSVYNERTEQIVFSFSLCNDLCTYDIEADSMTEHPNGYLNETFVTKKASDNYIRYVLKNPYFSQVLYDKYRNVYYRLYLEAIPEERMKQVDLRIMHYAPATVYIYDSTFKVIGEKRLPVNKHFLFDYFVDEKGLYINNYHPAKENIKEDEISYTLYKLTDM